MSASNPETLTAETADRLWIAMPDSLASKLSGGLWQPAPHLSVIAYLLYLSANRVLPRLIVNCPPGVGKTQITSHWFPVWLLRRDPTARIILASYAPTLAEEAGKEARLTLTENLDRIGVRLRQDSKASNRWRTDEGGGMWTTGTKGAATGRRASNFIIDDPHKDFAEAHSPVIREKIWNWYQNVARTRLLPGGSIACVMTRWHEDDLCGRLIEDGESGGERFTVVRFPAIAEEDETIETIIGEETVAYLKARDVPLPEWSRPNGAPLWPTIYNPVTEEIEPWYDLDEYAAIRSGGEHRWNGLYQQRPSSATGSYFPVEAWKFVDVAPVKARYERRWDLAGTKEGGDWTVGALLARDDSDGMTYVVDVVRDRLEIAGVKALVRATAELDRARYGRGKVSIVLEQEPGSSGKGMAAEFISDVLAGFPAKAIPTTGDKVVNALPFASQQQAGNVALVRTEIAPGEFVAAAWWNAFVEETRAFDSGPNDDQVDAASHGYADLVADVAKRGRGRLRSAAGSRLTERFGSPVSSGMPG